MVFIFIGCHTLEITKIIQNNEKVHKAEEDIKYLFCEKYGLINLLLLFQGFQMLEISNIDTSGH